MRMIGGPVRQDRSQNQGVAREAPSDPTRRGAVAWILTAAVAGAVGGPAPAQQPLPGAPPARRLAAPPEAIKVTAQPISAFDRVKPARRQFGRLEFRGGLVLSSASPDFGGWSGLVMSDDGRQ